MMSGHRKVSLITVFLLSVQITWSSTVTNLVDMPLEDTNIRLIDDLELKFRGDYLRASVHAHNKVVVCYVGTWATYRDPEEGSYNIEHIETSQCTHLIYSFAGLDNQTFVMKPMDPWLDQKLQENGGGRDWYKNFNDLKKKSPHLKVLLAVGGWNEGSKKYSEMAGRSENRESFVQSALDLVRKYRFDGLDLDWEFPGDRGGSKDDKRHFTILVQELRTKFDKYGLMLTAAFGPAKSTVDKGYELRELAKLLDHVHIMCYDYHGSWDKKTGHNAPLYAPLNDGSVEASVDYYLDQGVPANKIVLGLPFYGRTFLLADEEQELEGSALLRRAQDKGFQGPFTKEDGFLGYNEIVKELVSSRGDWKVYWDDNSKVPFMRMGNKWVTFDSPESLKEKVAFLTSRKLRGAMIWSIDTDDFQGVSGIKNPLLRTINYALSRDKTPSDIPATVKPPTAIASTLETIPAILLLLFTAFVVLGQADFV